MSVPLNRKTAMWLALLLGAVGTHKFYLKQYFRGVVMFVFAFTLIPLVFSLIDFLILLLMSEETFDKKYNQQPDQKHTDGHLPPISAELFMLINEQSERIHQVCGKLCQDTLLNDKLKATQLDFDVQTFMAACITFDVLSIIRHLKKVPLSPDMPEAIAVVLVVNRILPAEETRLALTDYRSVVKPEMLGKIRNLAGKIFENIGTTNPVNIQITSRDGQPVIATEKPLPELSLPMLLYVTQNPWLDEYATAVYRFSALIARADGIETERETLALKEIYQTLHHPDGTKSTNQSEISQGSPDETLDHVLQELNSLTGLDRIKEEVITLINFIQNQQERAKAGLKTAGLSYHIVFTGNPGTGKTTVARIIARIYRHLGILSKGHLVETDRSGLVAEYVGQTAVKVNRVVDSALNGVLFIDEAYALVGENHDDFGKEAVATLIRRMENDRDRLVVILAGYSGEMQNFIETNPGFRSRFNRYFEFDDFTPEQLVSMYMKQCEKLDYIPEKQALNRLNEVVRRTYNLRDRSFGNGRFIRNLFEKTIERQANRIAGHANPTRELLCKIIGDDIPA